MKWLTKSRFISGLQCHKRLWFEIHEPLETAPDPSGSMMQGRNFDAAVRDMWPGVLLSLDAGVSAAIEATSKLIAQGANGPSTLYQPAFRAGNNVVIADVLKRHGTEYDLMEVKASTGVKDVHLQDAAFQTWVLGNAGIPLKSIAIGHVNNSFVLTHHGVYDGLLTVEDVTERVLDLRPVIATAAADAELIMACTSVPLVKTGAHCNSPYDCPFMNRCHAPFDSATFPVSELPRGRQTADGLIADGYDDLRQVPPERLPLELHRRVQTAVVSGVPYFDETATFEIRDLAYPLAFLDFETINFAVPEVIGTRPYEQLPFQWSVHVERSLTDVHHEEFLAIENFADFDAMALALTKALDGIDTIFAYNANF